MIYTNGEAYFFIFCMTVVSIVFIRTAYELIRIRLVNNPGPCKRLHQLETEVRYIKRILSVHLLKEKGKGQ